MTIVEIFVERTGKDGDNGKELISYFNNKTY